MNRFVLSFGSNSDDRRSRVESALRHYDSVYELVNVSSIYETEPYGGVGERRYVNCVVEARSVSNLDAVVAEAKAWEAENGRDDAAKSRGIVPIDVDVVMWNDEILRPKEMSRDYFLIGYEEINA